MFCGMVTIGGARGLHDRRSGRSVVGSRLLTLPMRGRDTLSNLYRLC